MLDLDRHGLVLGFAGQAPSDHSRGRVGSRGCRLDARVRGCQAVTSSIRPSSGARLARGIACGASAHRLFGCDVGMQCSIGMPGDDRYDTAPRLCVMEA